MNLTDNASKPVTRKELKALLSTDGFTKIGITLSTSKGYYSTPEEAFAFNEARSFGNFLMHVPQSLRPQVKRDIAEEFERRRRRMASSWLRRRFTLSPGSRPETNRLTRRRI